MVYNLAEYFLHEALKNEQESIPNQVKKDTQRPSLAYVFRKFHGVQVLRITGEDQTRSILSKMQETLKIIIRC